MAADDRQTIRWSGDVVLDEPYIVDANATLHVQPGTRVSAQPGSHAYIVVQGRLETHGTRARPVTFELNATIQGPGEASARIVNTTFRVDRGIALSIAPRAGAVVGSSSFRGGAVGVHVPLAGEDGPRTRRIEVRGSTFSSTSERVGDAGPGAGLWVGGALEAERSSVPPRFVALRNLTFRSNDVGLLVGGDVPSLGVGSSTFRGNDRAVVTERAIVTLDDPRFHDNRVQIDAGSGGATVHVTGTELTKSKILAEPPSLVQADTVAVQDHPPWLRLSVAVASSLLVLVTLAKLIATRSLGAILRDRLTREDVLDHPLRRRIYEIVREGPGVYMSAVGKEVGGYHRARYHLLVLEEWGLVRSEMRDGLRTYYPVDVVDPQDEPTTRDRILHLIETNPGIEQNAIQLKLGYSRQLVSYHVGRLEEAERIVSRVSAGRKHLHPSSERDGS